MSSYLGRGLEQVDNIIQDYDVVCIDEVQFYPDSSIFCDKWANQGKIVEASGLNGDFKRQPFEQISKLIPLADKNSFYHLSKEINLS